MHESELPLSILMAAYACRPGAGSEPGNGWNWAAGVARRGHVVHLITPARNRAGIESVDASDILTNLKITYVDTRTVPSWFPTFLRTYGDYMIWQFAGRRLARQLIRLRHFDVAHHTTWGGLFFGSPLSGVSVPWVFGPIGGIQYVPKALMNELDFASRVRESLRAILYRTMPHIPAGGRRAVKEARIVVASNRSTAAAVERLGATQVKVLLPDAVVSQENTNGILKKRITAAGAPMTVLWLGRALPIKGLSLAVEAFAKASNMGMNAELIVIGGGPTLARARRQAREIGIDTSITFLGQLPWEDAQRHLQQGDIFLFTSLRDSFGAQVLEALHAGLPTVALAHHGVGDHCPDDVVVKVQPRDRQSTVEDLATAMHRLTCDPGMRRQMSLAASKWARKQVWSCKVEQMLEWYHSSAVTGKS